MKKQACRKCIYWELAINEGITEPYILETLRCEFETYHDNPKDTECKYMKLAKLKAKIHVLI